MLTNGIDLGQKQQLALHVNSRQKRRRGTKVGR